MNPEDDYIIRDYAIDARETEREECAELVEAIAGTEGADGSPAGKLKAAALLYAAAAIRARSIGETTL